MVRRWGSGNFENPSTVIATGQRFRQMADDTSSGCALEETKGKYTRWRALT